MPTSAEIALDVREVEALNYVFLRVMGQVFLSSSSNPVFNEMTGAQKRILYFLDLHGAQSMSQVARLVGCTVPAATAVVDKLVKANQVKRETSPTDRRVIRISLTETGHNTMTQLNEVHEQRLAEVLQKIEPEKRNELIRSFNRIHDILSELEEVERA